MKHLLSFALTLILSASSSVFAASGTLDNDPGATGSPTGSNYNTPNANTPNNNANTGSSTTNYNNNNVKNPTNTGNTGNPSTNSTTNY